MQTVSKYRIPAIFCALAVLVCELFARPFVNMGMIDDGAYVPMARSLAATGHIAYTGWSTAMLGLQLYFAAAFIRLFGYSFTAVRMSNVFVAVAMAFVFQRTLVRIGITERNATLGTLALVLSPLYLMLSATYMSDITGLFGIVLCLYGCLRSLQSATDRSSIAWLSFAVTTNAIFGTSRQIAWLGILIMVPSALWLMRARRRVLLAGGFANICGALFIYLCMQWLKRQAYVVPAPLNFNTLSLAHVLEQIAYFSLDGLFPLLPVLVLFLPNLRKARRSIVVPVFLVIFAYIFLAIYPSHLRGYFQLEPFGECINALGTFAYPILQGSAPIFLPPLLQVLLTLFSFAGLVGLWTLISRPPSTALPADIPPVISWRDVRVLIVPYSIAYTFLISQLGTTLLFHDRYLLGLLVIAIPCLVRYYQEHASPGIALASVVFVIFLAIYATVADHQMFAFYRARVILASELRAAGIPDTAVDNGWEYNFGVELQNASHINTPGIEVPANAYQHPSQAPPEGCPFNEWDYTPHIHPAYSISFDPNACYGPAPFAPVHYSRWPYTKAGTLYVVRSKPSSGH